MSTCKDKSENEINEYRMVLTLFACNVSARYWIPWSLIRLVLRLSVVSVCEDSRIEYNLLNKMTILPYCFLIYWLDVVLLECRLDSLEDSVK
jgi:hypothetical protein